VRPVKLGRSMLVRTLLACVLGVSAATLVSCGSSSSKLIPVADSSSLQGDFETVAQAAENADGSCSNTEGALLKTEQDFEALPASVDAGLRDRMREGINKLREDALSRCQEQSGTSTQKTTSTAKTTTPPKTQSTPTTSTPEETQSTPATSTPEETPETGSGNGGVGGGTPAEETPPGTGQGGGTGASENEGAAGTGATGGGTVGGAGATGAPSQTEGAK
jgi:hypothetical protein